MILHFSVRPVIPLGFCVVLYMFMDIGKALVQNANTTPTKVAAPIAHFTDVAAKAGLTAPVVFGGETTKKYIIETTGTGFAVFDYDNDGWPDIFIVNGTKLEGFPNGKT